MRIAQEITATILGSVTDASGAVISGAAIVVVNKDQAIVARNVLNGFLQVHIGHHSLTLPDSVLGISYLDANGVGSQADVFYEELRSLNPDIHAQPAVMLGHVMAHEIGHLLLGTNSHSSLGIMRAQWHKQEIARASSGMLIFDELQSQRMVARLDEALA